MIKAKDLFFESDEITLENFNLRAFEKFQKINKHFIKTFTSMNFRIRNVSLPSFLTRCSAYEEFFVKDYSNFTKKEQSKFCIQYAKQLAKQFTLFDPQITKTIKTETKIELNIFSKNSLAIGVGGKIMLLQLRIYLDIDDENPPDAIGIDVRFGTGISWFDTEHSLKFFNWKNAENSWKTLIELIDNLEIAINTVAKAIRLMPVK